MIDQTVKLIQQQITSHPTLLTAGCSYNVTSAVLRLAPLSKTPSVATTSTHIIDATFQCHAGSPNICAGKILFRSNGTNASKCGPSSKDKNLGWLMAEGIDIAHNRVAKRMTE